MDTYASFEDLERQRAALSASLQIAKLRYESGLESYQRTQMISERASLRAAEQARQAAYEAKERNDRILRELENALASNRSATTSAAVLLASAKSSLYRSIDHNYASWKLACQRRLEERTDELNRQSAATNATAKALGEAAAREPAVRQAYQQASQYNKDTQAQAVDRMKQFRNMVEASGATTGAIKASEAPLPLPSPLTQVASPPPSPASSLVDLLAGSGSSDPFEWSAVPAGVSEADLRALGLDVQSSAASPRAAQWRYTHAWPQAITVINGSSHSTVTVPTTRFTAVTDVIHSALEKTGVFGSHPPAAVFVRRRGKLTRTLLYVLARSKGGVPHDLRIGSVLPSSMECYSLISGGQAAPRVDYDTVYNVEVASLARAAWASTDTGSMGVEATGLILKGALQHSCTVDSAGLWGADVFVVVLPRPQPVVAAPAPAPVLHVQPSALQKESEERRRTSIPATQHTFQPPPPIPEEEPLQITPIEAGAVSGNTSVASWMPSENPELRIRSSHDSTASGRSTSYGHPSNSRQHHSPTAQQSEYGGESTRMSTKGSVSSWIDYKDNDIGQDIVVSGQSTAAPSPAPELAQPPAKEASPSKTVASKSPKVIIHPVIAAPAPALLSPRSVVSSLGASTADREGAGVPGRSSLLSPISPLSESGGGYRPETSPQDTYEEPEEEQPSLGGLLGALGGGAHSFSVSGLRSKRNERNSSATTTPAKFMSPTATKPQHEQTGSKMKPKTLGGFGAFLDDETNETSEMNFSSPPAPAPLMSSFGQPAPKSAPAAGNNTRAARGTAAGSSKPAPKLYGMFGSAAEANDDFELDF